MKRITVVILSLLFVMIVFLGAFTTTVPNAMAEDETFYLDIPSGWSMFSLPVLPPNPVLSELFPKAKLVYGYERGEGYVRIEKDEELKFGKGYWMLFDSAQTKLLTGQRIQEYPLSVNEGGWEMIGGCTLPAQVSADSANINVIYGFAPKEGYQRVLKSEKLQPGKGYWIRLSDSTGLRVDSGWPPGEEAESVQIMSDSDALSYYDNEVNIDCSEWTDPVISPQQVRVFYWKDDVYQGPYDLPDDAFALAVDEGNDSVSGRISIPDGLFNQYGITGPREYIKVRLTLSNLQTKYSGAIYVDTIVESDDRSLILKQQEIHSSLPKGHKKIKFSKNYVNAHRPSGTLKNIKYKSDVLIPLRLLCEYVSNPLNINTLHPCLSWSFKENVTRGQYQRAYQVLVASRLRVLNSNKGDLWDSGKVNSDENIQVKYRGKKLRSGTRYYWKVRVWDQDGRVGAYSEPAYFETGLLEESDWKNAAWIAWRPQEQWQKEYDIRQAKQLAAPVNLDDGWKYPTMFSDTYKGGQYAEFYIFKMLGFHDKPYDPAPLFRKEFILKKQIQQGRIYICGLGYYELYLNGKRVGDRLLDPGCTDSLSRVLYVAYDITEYLKSGNNAIGIMLGRGFPGSVVSDVFGFHKDSQQPKLRLRLTVEYSNGTSIDIVSQPGWKVTGGPVIFDDFFRGEVVDNRKELPGWNQAGFNDKTWDLAVKAPIPKGKLLGQLMPPIRATEEIRPVSVVKTEQGMYVYDFGRNISGWVRLKTSGPAGTEVLVRYSEKNDYRRPLPTKGSFYFAFQQHGFILRGDGIETFEPRFNYTAFRYVVVSGAVKPLNKKSLTAFHVHTDVAVVGEFECSNPLINYIHNAARLTQLNNMHSVPTDCPTREKHGWGGDGHVWIEAGIYNFDMHAFYEKWVNDIFDVEAQNGKGLLYYYAPRPKGRTIYCPCWEVYSLLVPWNLYMYYGNSTILADNYEAMKRYVNTLESGRVDPGKPHIVSDVVGDWLSPPGGQPHVTEGSRALPKEGKNIYGTAYYYYSVNLLVKIARVLKKIHDVSHYTHLAEDIQKAFEKEFYDPHKNCYRGEIRQITEYRQSADAIPLYLGLVPKEKQQAIIGNLLLDLTERNDRLNTGLLGTKALMEVLPAYGAGETAYRVAAQTEEPSWGHLMSIGLTTISEGWGGSGSWNHPAFSSVGSYFYRWLGGLQPDPEKPGFRHFFLRPTFVKDLTYVHITYLSPSGMIQSKWTQDRWVLTWDIVVPPNTRASLFIPAPFEKITENDQAVTEIKGVKFVSTQNELSEFLVESGVYRFKFPNKRNAGHSGSR